MKKFFIVVVLLLVLCTGLVACKEPETSLEEKQISIRTPEELQAINNYLGSKYAKYTFVLENDIDLSGFDWHPIGDSTDNSFRGTINGNNKIIKNLSIGDFTSGSDKAEKSYRYAGLFGYTFDATFAKLSLQNTSIGFISRDDVTYVGGLIGHAYGNTLISDITVIDENITLGTYMNYIIEKQVVDRETEEEGDVAVFQNNKQSQFIGGLVGFSNGSFTLKNANVQNVDIQSFGGAIASQFEKYPNGSTNTANKIGETLYHSNGTDNVIFLDRDYFMPDNQSVGNVVGLIKGSKNILSVVKSTNSRHECFSASLIAGNLFGTVYNASVIDCESNGNVAEIDITKKGLWGGVAGLFDDSKLTKTEANNDTITMRAWDSVLAYTVGGLFGYMNDSAEASEDSVSGFTVNTNQRNVNNNGEVKNYPVIGGLAGTMRNSVITKCKSGGNVLYGNEYGNGYIADAADKGLYTHTAGLSGYVFGNSVLSECHSAFSAYSGTTSICSDNIYINGDGKKVLRFAKENNDGIYYSVYVYPKVVNGNVLCVDIIDEAADVIATYEYDYSISIGGDMRPEEYIGVYYNKNDKTLRSNDGKVIVVDGIALENFVQVTGKYTLKDLTYDVGTATVVPSVDTLTADGQCYISKNSGGNII